MATRVPSINRRSNSSGSKDVIVTYTGLLNGDDGTWYSDPGVVLRATSWSGTFGVAGSGQVNATGGNAMGATPISGAQPDETIIGAAATVAGIVTGTTYTAAPSYRPRVTAGDGTTSLTCVMYFVQD